MAGGETLDLGCLNEPNFKFRPYGKRLLTIDVMLEGRPKEDSHVKARRAGQADKII
jgi:hypothetical protein